MTTQTFVGTLYVQTCCWKECLIPFGVPADFDAARRRDHKGFHCPRGHSQSYTGKSDVEKERDRAEKAEQQLAWARSREAAQRREKEAAERSTIAYKGHVTRLRNRIADGVCPVQTCRRNFANVKAHIETQHPEWAHDHAEALA